MPKRTYIPEDYEPETQTAMTQLLTDALSPEWCSMPDVRGLIADIIEKAVLEAKKVTQEKVRAGCAAVAEALLTKQGKR